MSHEQLTQLLYSQIKTMPTEQLQQLCALIAEALLSSDAVYSQLGQHPRRRGAWADRYSGEDGQQDQY